VKADHGIVQSEPDGAVVLLRLSRPPVNALCYEDWRRLRELVLELDRDPLYRAIVLTGLPGAHFSAGHDLEEYRRLSVAEVDTGVDLVHECLATIRRSRIPVIAALHGAVMGSALLLACACDIRVATADAKLALPELAAGAIGGYREMLEVLPRGEARWLIWTSDVMSGVRAHTLGLVQELEPDPAAALQRALTIATKLAAMLDDPLREIARPMLDAVERLRIEDGDALERDALRHLLRRRSGLE